jgi:DNA-binding response OmpR family regulator
VEAKPVLFDPAHDWLRTLHDGSKSLVSRLTIKDHRIRILIAETDPIQLELTHAVLSSDDFIVTTVSSGSEVMLELQTSIFDLLIMRLEGGQIDGFRLLPLIRATNHLKNFPILIVSSQTNPETKEEALQLGASDYLPKPINWPELEGHIRNLIEHDLSVS